MEQRGRFVFHYDGPRNGAHIKLSGFERSPQHRGSFGKLHLPGIRSKRQVLCDGLGRRVGFAVGRANVELFANVHATRVARANAKLQLRLANARFGQRRPLHRHSSRRDGRTSGVYQVRHQYVHQRLASQI